MEELQSKLVKSVYAGIDVGKTFFENMYAQSDILNEYRHEDLVLVMPRYLTDILCRYSGQTVMPQYDIDKEGYFRSFYGAFKYQDGYEDKIVLFHKDYPLLKRENMIWEFDLSLLVTDHA